MKTLDFVTKFIPALMPSLYELFKAHRGDPVEAGKVITSHIAKMKRNQAKRDAEARAKGK